MGKSRNLQKLTRNLQKLPLSENIFQWLTLPLDCLQKFVPIPNFYTIYDFPLSDQAPKAFILQPIVNWARGNANFLYFYCFVWHSQTLYDIFSILTVFPFDDSVIFSAQYLGIQGYSFRLGAQFDPLAFEGQNGIDSSNRKGGGEAISFLVLPSSLLISSLDFFNLGLDLFSFL